MVTWENNLVLDNSSFVSSYFIGFQKFNMVSKARDSNNNNIKPAGLFPLSCTINFGNT
jgi:hypothetical protein